MFIVRAIDSEGIGSNVSGTGTLTFTLSDGKQSVLANSTFSISIQLVPEWSTSDSEVSRITSTTLVSANGGTGNNMQLGYGGAAASYDGTYFVAVGLALTNQGNVTWFKRTGSSLTAISGTTLGQGNYSGRSCDITSDGKITAIGAEGVNNSFNHYVKIYKRANENSYNISPIASIIGPGYYTNSWFGASVSISDSDENGTIWLAVGAPQDSSHKSNNRSWGRAYLFYSTDGGDNWTQDSTASNILQGQVEYQGFGRTVSISKDAKYLFVSSPGNGYNTGTPQPIRVFTRSNTTWSETTSIANPPYDPAVSAQSNSLDSDGTGKIFGSVTSFGQELATDRTGSILAVAGGKGHRSTTDISPDGNGIYQSQVVRVYTRSGSTWTLQQRFESPKSLERLADTGRLSPTPYGEEESNIYFGTDGGYGGISNSRTLDLSDDGKILVIGASGEDSEGVYYGSLGYNNGGAIYVYTYSEGSGWNHLNPAVVMPTTVGGNNSYGKCVPISGDGKWILGVAATGYQPDINYGSNVILLKSDT